MYCSSLRPQWKINAFRNHLDLKRGQGGPERRSRPPTRDTTRLTRQACGRVAGRDCRAAYPPLLRSFLRYPNLTRSRQTGAKACRSLPSPTLQPRTSWAANASISQWGPPGGCYKLQISLKDKQGKNEYKLASKGTIKLIHTQ